MSRYVDPTERLVTRDGDRRKRRKAFRRLLSAYGI